jgi:hypothetical protein
MIPARAHGGRAGIAAARARASTRGTRSASCSPSTASLDAARFEAEALAGLEQDHVLRRRAAVALAEGYPHGPKQASASEHG